MTAAFNIPRRCEMADIENIRRVIREYKKRMLEVFEGRAQAVSTDPQIDCPECGEFRGLVPNGGNWRCLKRNCRFSFPENLIPPTESKLTEYLLQEKARGKIYSFLNS